MIFKDPPLARTIGYIPQEQIQLFLEEPLIGTPYSSKKEIYNLISTLDTLISKENITQPRIAQLIQEADGECLEYLNGRKMDYRQDISPLKQFIEINGWGDWFSNVSNVYSIAINNTNLSREEYTTKITQLNLTFSIAYKLRSGVSSPNSRYVAHQIALLYAALQQLGSQFKEFQNTIQLRFVEMKQTAGKTDSTTTRFNDEQLQWLTSLCNEILSRILFVESLKLPLSL